jgi:hypothetical protein
VDAALAAAQTGVSDCAGFAQSAVLTQYLGAMAKFRNYSFGNITAWDPSVNLLFSPTNMARRSAALISETCTLLLVTSRTFLSRGRGATTEET